jgi:hypothetical protein
MSPEVLRNAEGASVGGDERESEDSASEAGARDTWLLTSAATLVVALEDTVDRTSFSLSSEKSGRKTASMEFPSKSMIAAE